MADRIRINVSEGRNASKALDTQAQEALNYINGELTNTVVGFASWWEGDAYKAFLDDFNATKAKFNKEIYQEIKTYAANLQTAVTAQSEQDTNNAGSIKIN